jgi:hypothetical protein
MIPCIGLESAGDDQDYRPGHLTDAWSITHTSSHDVFELDAEKLGPSIVGI